MRAYVSSILPFLSAHPNTTRHTLVIQFDHGNFGCGKQVLSGGGRKFNCTLYLMESSTLTTFCRPGLASPICEKTRDRNSVLQVVLHQFGFGQLYHTISPNSEPLTTGRPPVLVWLHWHCDSLFVLTAALSACPCSPHTTLSSVTSDLTEHWSTVP